MKFKTGDTIVHPERPTEHISIQKVDDRHYFLLPLSEFDLGHPLYETLMFNSTSQIWKPFFDYKKTEQ